MSRVTAGVTALGYSRRRPGRLDPELAGPGRGLAGAGCRWRIPSPHLFEFSNRCQGHPRRQARGVGLCGGTRLLQRRRDPGVRRGRNHGHAAQTAHLRQQGQGPFWKAGLSLCEGGRCIHEHRPADGGDERGIGARRLPFAPVSGQIAARKRKTRPKSPCQRHKSPKTGKPVSADHPNLQARHTEKKQQVFLHMA